MRASPAPPRGLPSTCTRGGPGLRCSDRLRPALGICYSAVSQDSFLRKDDDGRRAVPRSTAEPNGLGLTSLPSQRVSVSLTATRMDHLVPSRAHIQSPSKMGQAGFARHADAPPHRRGTSPCYCQRKHISVPAASVDPGATRRGWVPTSSGDSPPQPRPLSPSQPKAQPHHYASGAPDQAKRT